jgi:hypothetical protein
MLAASSMCFSLRSSTGSSVPMHVYMRVVLRCAGRVTDGLLTKEKRIWQPSFLSLRAAILIARSVSFFSSYFPRFLDGGF